MNENELEARLSEFLDAAFTYTITPLTMLKYAKVFLGLDKKDNQAGKRPERRDPALISFGSKLFLSWIKNYMKVDVRGLNNLPESGPGLVVGNHNGGMVPVDTFIAGCSVARFFGSSRPFYALAHDFLFREPALANLLERFGALKAGHDTAAAAFERGGLLLVYPGGDHETFREYRDRNLIDFAGRKGFIKLALLQNVPIYPCVSTGCHETFFVLTRGEWIAEKFGLKSKLRTGVFPIVFSLPWGITSGFLPYIPLPGKIIIEFLEPVRWSQFSASDAENPAVINFCYNDIVSKMQNALTRISQERSDI